MTRPSIENIRSLGDFATVYNWNVEVQTAPQGVPIDTNNLNLRCVSTTIPTLADSKITVSVRGHKVFQPGVHTYSGTIDLTVVETIDSVVNNWLLAWRELCWQNTTGVQALKSDAQATIIIRRLNRQDNEIWAYKLIGCFLENYTQPTLEAEGNSFNPTMSLAYDYFVDVAGNAA